MADPTPPVSCETTMSGLPTILMQNYNNIRQRTWDLQCLQSLPYCWHTNTYLSRPPVPTHSMLFTNRKSANSQGVWTNCAFQHWMGERGCVGQRLMTVIVDCSQSPVFREIVDVDRWVRRVAILVSWCERNWGEYKMEGQQKFQDSGCVTWNKVIYISLSYYVLGAVLASQPYLKVFFIGYVFSFKWCQNMDKRNVIL